MNESLPAPLVTVSLPAPPSMMSLPRRPLIVSFPPPPVRALTRLSPLIVSLADPPMEFSIDVRTSLPICEPFAVPTPSIDTPSRVVPRLIVTAVVICDRS